MAQAPTALRTAVRSALGRPSRARSASLEHAKLTPADAAAGDSFGYSVAVSGSTAVVGAQYKNSSKGVAYVFVSSGTIWSQQAELKATGAASSDLFGYSVAISGSTAVVGAPGRSSSKGAAYVFVRSGTIWSQQARLIASDIVSGDSFGISVAVSGSTAVVGAYNKNFTTGAAYVFVRKVTAWSQQAELTASDGAAFDGFGYSVAISGTNALVGAYGKSSTLGAAYVFVRPGTVWFQQTELTAADGVSGDLFGYSVAISGDIALVGACCKDSSTGAAYVFVRSGAAWPQQARVTAADSIAGDRFGYSVAVSGETALVGACCSNSSTGAAYGFVRSGTKWIRQTELTASDGVSGDLFGSSVALSGSTAVIGASGSGSTTGAAYVDVLPSQQAELNAISGASINSFFGYSVAVSGSTAVVGAFGHYSPTGAAYVFVRSGTVWSQQAELAASDGAVGDHFGFSVSVVGSTAVVGAYGQSAYQGAVYVFDRSGTTWSQQARLIASDGAPNDGFGYSVALSSTTLVVGAHAKNSYTGAAYVFVGSGAAWTQQAELTASGGAPNDGFGISVALSGSTAVVGANGLTSFKGAAYVFVRSVTTWSQQAELTAADGVGGDQFGWSVGMSGSTAVVGAHGKDTFRGAAYLFVRSGGKWSHQQAELTAPDLVAYDNFGGSVAISGSTVVVGAYYKTSNAGSAYVFARSRTAWSPEAKLTASDGGTVLDFFGNSVALSGSTAVIGAPGKDSSTGAAYVFLLP